MGSEARKVVKEMAKIWNKHPLSPEGREFHKLFGEAAFFENHPDDQFDVKGFSMTYAEFLDEAEKNLSKNKIAFLKLLAVKNFEEELADDLDTELAKRERADNDDDDLDLGFDDDEEDDDDDPFGLNPSPEEKLVWKHREKGDLIDFLLSVRDSVKDNNREPFNNLLDLLYEEEKKEYKDKIEPHIKALAEEHKSKGDYAKWLDHLSKNDEVRYKYVVEHFGEATKDDSASNESEIEEKLSKLKKLFDKGLISESDYNKKKDALLEDL